MATLPISTSDSRSRILRVQLLTIAWMTVEATISLFAAWRARSPALAAFGGDSIIELASAMVVLWRFSSPHHGAKTERLAAQITGVLLLVLAAFVVVSSVLTLRGYNKPETSLLGVCVLLAAAILMPLLAREKRKLSASTGSAALRADAAQSSACAYLSLIALGGLLLNAAFGWGWADPAAALAITPLLVWESREALRGRPCGCC